MFLLLFCCVSYKNTRFAKANFDFVPDLHKPLGTAAIQFFFHFVVIVLF